MSCQCDKGSRVVFQCNLNVVETIGNGSGTLEMARQIGQLAFQVRFGRKRKNKGFYKVLICSREEEGGAHLDKYMLTRHLEVHKLIFTLYNSHQSGFFFSPSQMNHFLIGSVKECEARRTLNPRIASN